MNGDFVQAYLRNALQKGLRNGGTAFIEELVDGLPEEALLTMQAIIAAVLKRKAAAKKDVDAKVTPA